MPFLPESIDLSSLPSILLSERRKLPHLAGIYICITPDKAILYIGRSINIAKRWLQHHRYPELRVVSDIRIAWVEVSDASLLPGIETALIKYFSPPLNRKIIPPRKKGSPGNPNPVITVKFTRVHERCLAKRVTGVRLYQEVESALYALPSTARSEWLRKVITEAAIKDGLVSPLALPEENRSPSTKLIVIYFTKPNPSQYGFKARLYAT